MQQRLRSIDNLPALSEKVAREQLPELSFFRQYAPRSRRARYHQDADKITGICVIKGCKTERTVPSRALIDDKEAEMIMRRSDLCAQIRCARRRRPLRRLRNTFVFMCLHHITGEVRPDKGSAPFFAARRGIDMPRPPGHAARRRFWVAKFTAPLQGWSARGSYLANTGSNGSSLNEEVYRY